MLAQEKITALEGKGFKRWTKGNMDRLYINASQLGLVCEYHKTGSISAAYLEGIKVSNSEAYRMKSSKTFYDLKTGTLHSDNWMLKSTAQKLIDEITK